MGFFRMYFNVYRGLSQPVWMLAFVMLVNRTGAMVIPFLGLYMVETLHFSLQDAGLVLSCFGVGSVIGSSVGGWLTDKLGAFKVQFGSLICVVPMFFILPELQTVQSFSIGVLLLSVIGEIFRPANSVSLSTFSTPENVVRSFTLNRMALNLGFSIGPALGGFLAAISYSFLFYGNGIAALISAIIFFFYFRNRNSELKQEDTESDKNTPVLSPYKDVPFLIFSFLSILFAICFFQLLSTLPLYYREVYQLKEHSIGMLLAFSGVVVFSLEMLVVHLAEKYSTAARAIILGALCCGFSFVLLVMAQGMAILYISMFILCIAEILAMPFMATVTLKRSTSKNRGAYMGLNSLSLSAGHVFAPYMGMWIAQHYGFNTLWIGTGLLMLSAAIGFYFNMKRLPA